MNIRYSSACIATRLIIVLALMLVTYGCNTTGTDTNSGPSFSSGNLAPGETFSFTFMDEGTPYYCRNHEPNMTGEVIVSQNASISGVDTVRMKDIAFHPQQITVKPGTKIVWINNETNSSIDDHTVTSGSPSGNGGGY